MQDGSNHPGPSRRALLKSMAAMAAAAPLTARAVEQFSFGDREIAALTAIAEVGLPSAVDARGRADVVAAFVAWHRNYKEGADRGHGYGASTLSAPTGPAPSARYAAQFTALDTAATSRGVATFASLPPTARREVVEAALNEPQRVNRLPARPTGANLVADFLGFYFNSAAAWDLAYEAEIGRDNCRTLDNSERAPAPRGSGR